jgi:hypothetical protein
LDINVVQFTNLYGSNQVEIINKNLSPGMIAEGGRRNTGIPETGFFTYNQVLERYVIKNSFST